MKFTAEGSPADEAVQVPLPRELKWFFLVSAGLWTLSLAYVAFVWHSVPVPFHGLPEVFFSRWFTDALTFNSALRFVHQPEFFSAKYNWVYPAPCVFLYKLLLLQWERNRIHGPRPIEIFYCLLVLLGLSLLIWRMKLALSRRGLAGRTSWILMVAATILSWPLAFSVHQGNVEALLWMGVAIAVWAYYRGMWWTSALMIGFIAGFKIYPILLLGLFLAPRKYAQIAVSLATFVAFTLLSLTYIGPTVPIAYHNVSLGIKNFTDLGFYPGAIDRDYLTFEHSLVSLIRILTTAHPEYMLTLSRYYLPTAGLLMTIFFFTFIWKMPRLNQLFVILLAIVLLPPKSYDYTLLMLYIPWAWLCLLAVSAARTGAKIPGMMPVMICLALIFAPEFFIRYQGFNSYGQFKTFCLLVLLGLVARYQFADIRLSETVELS